MPLMEAGELSGFLLWVQGLDWIGFRLDRVQGLGFRVQGSGFRVQGSGWFRLYVGFRA